MGTQTDFYMEKVTSNDLSLSELRNIFNDVSKISNTRTEFDDFALFLEISKSKNADDSLIAEMITAHPDMKGGGFEKTTFLWLDNGSKQLFDSIWKPTKQVYEYKYWKSKHADSAQLKKTYDKFISGKKDEVNNLSNILKHPNLPDDFLTGKDKIKENHIMISLSQNPLIANKPVLFNRLIKYINDQKEDANYLFGELLKNCDKSTWKKVADGIGLEKNIDTLLKTNKKKDEIIAFCMNDECPDNIKLHIYEKTGLEEFLPQAAKDVFLF